MATHANDNGDRTAHDEALARFLGALPEQWVDGTFVDRNESDDTTRTRLVTSGGYELTAQTIKISGRRIEHRDPIASGFVVAATRLEPDGSMRWELLGSTDATDTAELTVSTPWTLRGLYGEAAAASAQATVGHHPATGFRFARPEALEAWASSPRSRLDIDILEQADDDWLHTDDVVGVLVEAGITDDEEILRRSINLVAALLSRGDIVAGTVDNGFHQTSEPLPELIERIAATWTYLGGRGAWGGSICWFDITETGREHLYALRPHLRP